MPKSNWKHAKPLIVVVLALVAAMAFDRALPFASAATFSETQTDSIPATPTDWETPPGSPDPLVFDQFDAVNGTLTQVKITFDTELTGSMQVENFAPSSTCDVSLVWAAEVTLDTTAGVLDSTLEEIRNPPTLGVFDGLIDFDGSSGISFVGLNQADSQVAFITGAGLAPFIGGGTIALNATATGVSGFSGCGNVITQFITNAAVDVEVEYTFDSNPAIHIEKATNGQDADLAPGPAIPAGGPVAWTYVVTNIGDVQLTNVVVTDDKLGTISGPDSGDTNSNSILEINETWLYSANGSAAPGQYTNVGLVGGTAPSGTRVVDDDPSHYFGGAPSIDIEKATNGEDADSATGPTIQEGDLVEWTYVVSNGGTLPLSNIVVTDDDLGVILGPDSGDTNDNGILETTEVWNYSASGSAESGQYTNIGRVVGSPPSGPQLSDEDPSHYFGISASIDIEKATNGQDADTPTGPTIALGETVTWTYVVRNTGNWR